MRQVLLIIATAFASSAPDGDDPPAMKPVTLSVVEADSGAPVSEFSYRASYRTVVTTAELTEGWDEVETPTGTVELQAPTSCRLIVSIRTPEIMADTPDEFEFVLRSDDRERRVEARIEIGVVVEGFVRDVDTGTPLFGARIRHTPPDPYLSERDDRVAYSDFEGRYRLPGVNPILGIYIDYDNNYELYDGPPIQIDGRKWNDFWMEQIIPTLVRGIVEDPSGRRLAGVEVSVTDAVAETARDGSYALWIGRTFGATLKVRKPGYSERWLYDDGWDIPFQRTVLAPLTPLFGRVLGHDGQPVPNFEVMAEAGVPYPGRLASHEPACTYFGAVADPGGRFEFDIVEHRKYWVGVRADGYARWESRFDTDAPVGPLEVRLREGAVVSGRLILPGGSTDRTRVLLEPRRTSRFYRVIGTADRVAKWGADTVDVGPDGAFRFDHVAPDRYLITVSGPSLKTSRWAFDLPEQEERIDLGELPIPGLGPGVGRLVGRVMEPAGLGEGPLAYARGGVHPRDAGYDSAVEIVSDEDGRFEVDSLPEGTYRVGFAADAGNSYLAPWIVQIVEGRTTEVTLYDPKSARPLAIRLKIGDGSEAAYEAAIHVPKLAGFRTLWSSLLVALDPLPGETVVFQEPFWHRLEEGVRFELPDVGPGEYHLRVIGYLNGYEDRENVIGEADVAVPPAEPIEFPIGDGSITGRFRGTSAHAEKPEVVAVPRGRADPLLRPQYGTDSRFLFVFLEHGTYDVYGRDHQRWFRSEGVAVASGLVDLGDLDSTLGGTVRGTIGFPKLTPEPDEVLVRAAAGAAFRKPFGKSSSHDAFEVGGLWPGHWTVEVRASGRPIASRDFEIIGVETVEVALIAGGDADP